MSESWRDCRAAMVDLKQSQHVDGGDEMDFERRLRTLLSFESENEDAGRSIKHI